MHQVKMSYDAERGVRRWLEKGSAEGAAPDLWPYGLNRIADLGIDLVHKDNPPLNLYEDIRHLMRADWESSRGRGPAAQVSMAWDEGAAKRLLVRDRSERNHCGVIWVNDMVKRTDPPLVWAALHVLREMDSLWCLSTAQVQPLEELIPGMRVDPLLFGVDPDFFGYREYPDNQSICSIGVDRHRDPDTLFRALARIRDTYTHDQAKFLVQSRSEDPPNWLTLLPLMPPTDLREVYARSAVVVVTTRPNLHVSGMTVALEGMATGRPVVITRSPGMEDYVEDGVTGTIVEQGDDKAIADAIRRYLDDPGLAAEHGRNGRKRVETLLNTARMCADLYRILELERVTSDA